LTSSNSRGRVIEILVAAFNVHILFVSIYREFLKYDFDVGSLTLKIGLHGTVFMYLSFGFVASFGAEGFCSVG
jgi:hypothetical protein